jgi:hypothetical protein
MVVNDDIKIDSLKRLVMGWLRVDNGKAGELLQVNLLDWKHVEFEQPNHGQVVRPCDHVYVRDGSGRDLPPQEAF